MAAAKKKPTRRKAPSEPFKVFVEDYSKDDGYYPPATVTLYGFILAILIVAVPAILSYGHLNGWW